MLDHISQREEREEEGGQEGGGIANTRPPGSRRAFNVIGAACPQNGVHSPLHKHVRAGARAYVRVGELIFFLIFLQRGQRTKKVSARDTL